MVVIILHALACDVLIGPFPTLTKAITYAVNNYGFAYQGHWAWRIRNINAP